MSSKRLDLATAINLCTNHYPKETKTQEEKDTKRVEGSEQTYIATRVDCRKDEGMFKYFKGRGQHQRRSKRRHRLPCSGG